MKKRDKGNCESVDSLGHVNYTVTVMIIVSLCLHFLLLFVAVFCLFVFVLFFA